MDENGNAIRFSLQGNNKKYVEINKETGDIKFNKADKKLKSIFEEIAKIDGDSDKIDADDEKVLVEKLQKIFSKDDDATISKDELKWVKKLLADAKSFAKNANENGGDYGLNYNYSIVFDIEDKYKELYPKADDEVVNEKEADESSPANTEVPKTADTGNQPRATINNTVENLVNCCTDDVSEDNSAEYTVKKGDTLWHIAAEHLKNQGTANPSGKQIMLMIAGIKKLNPQIADVNRIQVGQKIKVPANPAGDDANAQRTSAGTGVRSANLPQTKVTCKPDGTYFDSSVTDAEGFYYWPVVKDSDGTVVCYEAIITIGEYWCYTYADSVDELKSIKSRVETELAKIKEAPEHEEPDAAADRKTQNIRSIINIAKFSNNNLDVLLGLIRTYTNNDDFVDSTSSEYDNFLKSMLGTRNSYIIEAINFKTGDKDADGRYEFRGSDANFENLATVYKEIRDKENAGQQLTDDEKDLKFVLSEEYDGKLTIFNLRTNYIKGDEEVNRGKYIDFDGNTRFLGKTGDYEAIGINNISAESEALIDEFEADYKAALQKIDDAEEANKEAVTKEEFKNLYKKYADKTDKTFASSVLTSALLTNADVDDIKKAIDSNGAEFLMNLNSAIGATALDEATKTAILKSITDRAVKIYTEEDKGNPANMRYLIPNAEESVLESYFVVNEAEDGSKTYTFKPKRRMTYQESEKFFEVLNDNNREDLIRAALSTMELNDLSSDSWVNAARSELGYDIMRDTLGELAGKLESQDDVISLCRWSYYSQLPFDKIMEKWSENDEVTTELRDVLKRSYFCVISDENIYKLMGIEQDESGKFTFDKSKLPESVTVKSLVDILKNQGCTEEGVWKNCYDAIYNAIDFSAISDDIGQFEFLDNVDAKLSPEQRDKLITALQNNSDLVASKVFQDANKIKRTFTPNEINEIYNAVGPANKKRMINDGVMGDAMVVVTKGDKFDNILKNYLKNNLDKFPRLKKAVENDPEKWTESRIDEALNDYCRQFRGSIMNELNINPTKMHEGDIIDLRNLDFSTRQPSWFDWQSY